MLLLARVESGFRSGIALRQRDRTLLRFRKTESAPSGGLFFSDSASSIADISLSRVDRFGGGKKAAQESFGEIMTKASGREADGSSPRGDDNSRRILRERRAGAVTGSYPLYSRGTGVSRLGRDRDA